VPQRILIAGVVGCLFAAVVVTSRASATSAILVSVMPLQGTPTGFTAETVRDELIDDFQALGFYQACRFVDADRSNPKFSDCGVADASLLIRPALTGNKLTLSVLATSDTSKSVIQPVSLTLSATGAIVEADFDAAFGTPKVLADGSLQLGALPTPPAFQQGVQIIPLGTEAPSYLDDVLQMFAQRGIVAVNSGITGVTLAASTPDSAICNAGQQYFAYTVLIDIDSKPIIGFSRVGAGVNGWYFDCARHIMLPAVGVGDRRDVATLSNTVTQYGAILAAFGAFKRWNLTPNFAVGLPLAANFVSVDPNNADIRHRVGDLALQRLVDNLCNVADETYTPALAPPTPSPAPSPPGRNLQILSDNVAVPGAAPAASTAQSGDNLAFGQLTSTHPFLLRCNNGPTNALHVDKPENTFQFYGWTAPRPAPSPLPTSVP
jgi:hypothetical protein